MSKTAMTTSKQKPPDYAELRDGLLEYSRMLMSAVEGRIGDIPWVDYDFLQRKATVHNNEKGCIMNNCIQRQSTNTNFSIHIVMLVTFDILLKFRMFHFNKVAD
jgi:hypothetical protein